MAARKKRKSSSRMAGAYISSVLSVALVLILVGVSALLLLNSGKVSDYLKENLKLSVMLSQNITDEEGAAFLEELKERPYVSEAVLISREQGEAELREMLGDDFLDVFDAVPVPVSIDLNLKPQYVQPDSLLMVKEELEKFPMVDEVESQQAMVEELSASEAKMSMIMLVLTIFLVFISFVLITNVVRLSLDSRRYSVHTMQMVGASRSFIRRPFIGQAALLSLISSFIALAALWGFLSFVKDTVPQIYSLFTVRDLAICAGAVVLFGLLLCVVSTFFTVNRLLSMNKHELYGPQ